MDFQILKLKSWRDRRRSVQIISNVNRDDTDSSDVTVASNDSRDDDFDMSDIKPND